MLTQQELGQRLKSAREAIGLTQQQVADLLAHNEQANHVALTRVAISQIESGQRTVSSIELMHLSRLYGRDMASFLEERVCRERRTGRSISRSSRSRAKSHLLSFLEGRD